MQSIPYIKTLMMIIYPFTFSFLLMIFWILYKFYWKINFAILYEEMFISMTITFVFFQSTIIHALADLMSCTSIENEKYIQNYLLEQCTNNPRYNVWQNFMIIPSFCFYCIILSLVPFVYMCKYRNRLFEWNILSKIGFLLHGYSSKKFYWYLHYFIILILNLFLGNLFSF